MTDTTKIGTIEHSGNSVYAVHTEEGPAIYPTLDDLLAAVKAGTIEVSDGDAKYYAGRDWHRVTSLGTLDDYLSAMPVDGPTGQILTGSDGTPDQLTDYDVIEYRKTADGFRAMVSGPSGDIDLIVDDATGSRIYRGEDSI